jgi:hypothetical protein
MNRTHRIRRVAPVVLAALMLGIVLGLPARADFEVRQEISTDSLNVANLIGEVRIQGHGGSSFQVVVNVRGRDGTRENISVETFEGNPAKLAVVFPVGRESNYVYPRMSGGRTTINLDDDDASWLSKLLGGKRATIRSSGKGLEVWADMEIRVPSGGALSMTLGVGEINAENVDGELRLDTSSGHVSAAGIGGDLSVDTGSGHVEARDVEGALLVDTGSGHVVLENIRGDEVNIDTGSGHVEMDQVKSPIVRVDTGSGHVEAQGVSTDSANIDTGSGSVTLQLDRMGDGDYRIDTGSGRITLVLPADASADVTAETGSGGIDVDLAEGVEIRRREEDEISLRIGDGRSRVRLDTGSGSIRITR